MSISTQSERRLLQCVFAAASLVPLIAGGAGMILGPWMIAEGTVPRGLDSHFRYLSGLLFAIGLGYVSSIPRIEHQGQRVWLLTALVFVGGIGRLISLISLGAAPATSYAALTMELLVAPACALWQRRVERRLR